MAKKLFTLFMLLALFFGVGRAETVTVTKTMNEIVAEYGYTVSSDESNINPYTQCFVDDNIFLVPNCQNGFFGGSSTIEWRVYYVNIVPNLQIVATEGCTLQSVTFTYSDASTGVLTYNDNDVPSGTPCAISGNPVSFQIMGTTVENAQAQVGITSISVTYEKGDRVVGDWIKLTYGNDFGVEYYECIILDKDKTKVAGSYENGHFTALPCEGNVVFCDKDAWGRETVKVTGDGVKRFTIEYDRTDENYTRYHFLKDTDGNYYYPDANGNIVASKQSDIFKTHDGPTVSIINDNNRIVYNPDESYFGAISGTTKKGDLIMYFRPKPMTLKEIRENYNDHNNYDTYKYYTLNDELQVVKSIARFGQTDAVALVCKDDGPAWDASTIPDDCDDYMTTHVGFNGDWDQSNWIILQPTVLSYSNVEKFKACEGMRLAANFTIRIDQQHMLDNLIAKMEANDLVIVEDSQPTTYTPNLYCPANFQQSNHNGEATGHEADGTPTDDHYFFMNPKMQELCEITYAVWTIYEDNYGKYGVFVLPASDEINNPDNIYGAVRANWDLNNDPVYDPETGEIHRWPAGLVEGAMYRLHGIVYGPIYRKGEPYYIKGEPSSLNEDEEDVIPGNYRADRDYVEYEFYRIYPIDFDPMQHVVTGIKDVVEVTGKTVAGVKYYNLAGIESDRPFEGVNIVVTTYTDGSRSSSKVLK